MAPNPLRELASVILLTVDDVDFTVDCVRSIAAGTYQPHEIVVVCNGTPADIQHRLEAELAKVPNTRVVPAGQNLGFSAGNNFGVDVSRGNYVAFINNDMTVDPAWLHLCVQVLQERPDVGAVQGMQLQMRDPDLIDCAGCYLDRYGWSVKHQFGHQRLTAATYPQYVSYASGGNFVMRRSDFDAVGRFDSDFEFYYEDADLGWRTWIHGLKALYLPEAVVWHYGSAYHSRHAFARTNAHLRTNQLCMLLKNGEGTTVARSLLTAALLMTASAAYFAAVGDIARAASYGRAFSRFFRRLPRTLRSRRRVQRLRAVSDEQIMRQAFYPRSAFLDESAPQALG